MLVFITLLALESIHPFSKHIPFHRHCHLSCQSLTVTCSYWWNTLLSFLPGFNFWNQPSLGSQSCVFTSLRSLPWGTSHSEYSVFWFQPYTSASLFKYSAPNIPCQHSMELSNLDSVVASVLPGLHNLHLSTYENALPVSKKPSLTPSSQWSFHPLHLCSWGPAPSTSYFVSRQYLSVVGNRGSATKLWDSQPYFENSGKFCLIHEIGIITNSWNRYQGD